MTADTTSIELTGLTEYGVYLVSVAAVNDYGIGPYSGAQNVYTCKLFICIGYSVLSCMLIQNILLASITMHRLNQLCCHHGNP